MKVFFTGMLGTARLIICYKCDVCFAKIILI
jgi:hypothetical protein